jgi:acetate kinase
MGFTPLAGLAMGTRAGDIDPAIITFMMEELNLSAHEVMDVVNKKSGVLGISGLSSDFRDLWAASETNRRAQLALDVFHYKIRTFICSYAGALGGVDCIIFTAGIGENSSKAREACCEELEFLGVKIDKEKNNVAGKAVDVSAADSRVKILVIPTNEELMIARDTMEIVVS